MSYGPPSPEPNEAKPFADNRSQDDTAVTKASNNFIFVLSFKFIHLYYMKLHYLFPEVNI